MTAINALPADISSLHNAASQLVLHYRASAPDVLPDRKYEINTRYADIMLRRVLARGETLSQNRGPNERTVGCCRDSAILFVSLARSKGYAARIRVGFAPYFDDNGLMLDHTVAEIWDAQESRWRLVDANVPRDWVRKVDGQVVDWLNLRPGIDFQNASQAWLLARAGTIDANRYTVFAEAPPGALRGLSFIGHNVAHDLAGLDKKEMLLWEDWGARNDYTEEVPAAEVSVLDEVSMLIQEQSVDPGVVSGLMAREELTIPDVVMLYDPYAPADAPKPEDVSRITRV